MSLPSFSSFLRFVGFLPHTLETATDALRIATETLLDVSDAAHDLSVAHDHAAHAHESLVDDMAFTRDTAHDLAVAVRALLPPPY